MLRPLATPGWTMEETDFLKRFPRLFVVRALSRWEARRAGYMEDKTYWQYVSPFEFVSTLWGPIIIPTGFVTDFASVPKFLHGLYDDDCPILLYPSAPHDLLFTLRSDGTRGWLEDGRQLTLRQVNSVLCEAMEVCGANVVDRGNVFAAVQIANQHIEHQFRSSP